MEKYSGVFMNYSIGRKMQYAKKGIIKVLNWDFNQTGKVVGWWIGWPEKNAKMFGRIIGHHGKNGHLLVKFKKGLPGQAIGTKIIIFKNKSDIQI